MRCSNCNSEWDSKVKVLKCPFCGKPLKESREEMTVQRALEKLVENFGLEVLRNPKKIVACVKDYVSGYQREKDLLQIAGESGIFELMFVAKNGDSSVCQNAVIERAMKKLEEEKYISEEYARYIVMIIADGIGVSYSKKQPEVKAERRKAFGPQVQPSYENSEDPLKPDMESRKPERNEIDAMYRQGMEAFGESNYNIGISYLARLAKALEAKSQEADKPGWWNRFYREAEAGDADAQYRLGLSYEHGKGVPQDYMEALKWYRKAAGQGHAAAKAKIKPS